MEDTKKHSQQEYLGTWMSQSGLTGSPWEDSGIKTTSFTVYSCSLKSCSIEKKAHAYQKF